MLMPSYVLKVKEPDTDKPAPKRKKRRERVQEATQISTLQVCIFLKKKNLNTLKFELPLYSLANCDCSFQQKIVANMKRFLLVVTLLVVLVAVSYYGYKGLLWLSDWMNEVEERKQRRHPRIWSARVLHYTPILNLSPLHLFSSRPRN